jgi:hypothetical protein
MKPIRVVQDIVRPKTVGKPRGGKAVVMHLKNAANAVSRSFSVKIPFFVWLVIILAEGGYMVKTSPEIISYLSTFQWSAAWVKPDGPASTLQEAMIAQNVVVLSSATSSPVSTSTPNATSSDALSLIEPGLLPMVQMSPFIPVSAATSGKVFSSGIKSNKSKSTSAAPTVITAASLLDATTISMRERYDGPYKITLITDAGTYGKVTWDFTATTLTISKSVPSFSISFSCNPPPNQPVPGAFDQNPTFNVRTSYACTISLTPLSGNDQQTQSKQFSFATDAGQLIVTSPSSMNTVLTDNTNSGGFVFTNDDTEPITVTGLDIDASYRGLNITENPLILRFEDPATETSLADYHLEDLAADPSTSYAHTGTDIQIPVSFTVPASSQKMLPVDILGVHRLGIYGIDPTITIALRQVTTNQNVNRIALNSAKISWSCIVPLGAYDPNATSGPYASGQACQ